MTLNIIYFKFIYILLQVGVASFTSSKRPGDVPGVFTRVSSYVDWIHQEIKKAGDTI